MPHFPPFFTLKKTPVALKAEMHVVEITLILKESSRISSCNFINYNENNYLNQRKVFLAFGYEKVIEKNELKIANILIRIS